MKIIGSIKELQKKSDFLKKKNKKIKHKKTLTKSEGFKSSNILKY